MDLDIATTALMIPTVLKEIEGGVNEKIKVWVGLVPPSLSFGLSIFGLIFTVDAKMTSDKGHLALLRWEEILSTISSLGSLDGIIQQYIQSIYNTIQSISLLLSLSMNS
ncbi:MAG: hypothetical protein GQ558_05090 [Thermoplasmata archaeon]|nr:hypothetical protein [Thermoplasmata archaeon]